MIGKTNRSKNDYVNNVTYHLSLQFNSNYSYTKMQKEKRLASGTLGRGKENGMEKPSAL